MAVPYNHREVEKKWQTVWDDEKAFKTSDDFSKPKYYALVEFPYPSGQGLHVGHPRPYTALDIVARKRRMQGYNVLYPMGWDAFGLPTENYAIKNKVHPKEVTKKNVARFKAQLQALGYSFDWDREINTTDPNYYKWTQWIFVQMFKKGLAYVCELTPEQFKEFAANIDYFVFEPNIHDLNDLGWRYLAQHMDMLLPPELLKAIDPVPFGKYAMQEEQGYFTEHGYISLSGDEWNHERPAEPKKKPSIRERLEQGKKECAEKSKAQPHKEKSAPEL